MGVSFETYLKRRGDVLMRRRHYVPLRRRHDIIIRLREDVPLTRLRDVPLRRRWVFHLTLPATSLGRTERRRYDVSTTSFYRVWITLPSILTLTSITTVHLQKKSVSGDNSIFRPFHILTWYQHHNDDVTVKIQAIL